MRSLRSFAAKNFRPLLPANRCGLSLIVILQRRVDHQIRISHDPLVVLSLQQITEAALHLSERERLGVTAALWKSLGGNDEALADIQALARAHELDSGEVQPKSHADVFRNARASLG